MDTRRMTVAEGLAETARARRPALKGAQVLRLRLMLEALKAGLAEVPEGADVGAAWWSALAPLKANEVVGVRKEVARLRKLPPAEASAELLVYQAQIGGPAA